MKQSSVKKHKRKVKGKTVTVKKHSRKKKVKKNRGVLVGEPKYKLIPQQGNIKGRFMVFDIDKSIEPALKKINEAGYKTEWSHSGISKDHVLNDISGTKGFMNKQEYERNIKQGMADRNLFDEGDPYVLFKLPDRIVTRETGTSMSRPYNKFNPTKAKQLSKIANESGFKMLSWGPKEVNFIIKEKTSDKDKLKRFNKLADMLTQLDV